MPANIYIDQNLLVSSLLIEILKSKPQNFAIITDDNVGPLYAEKLADNLKANNMSAHTITIKHGEANKTRATKAYIEDQLLAHGFGRDTTIIALGGGVVTDIAGFVAATFCRGVAVIYLPTTLLAMVDAAIGGKTGVDTIYGKNLIGCFKQADAVLMDLTTLKTLPEAHYRFAFAEIIKHALIADKEYFAYLKANYAAVAAYDLPTLTTIISKSVAIKTKIITQDPQEAGLRAILNFGHTFGHAIELLSDYQIFHGEAVALGLLAEAYLSVLFGHLQAKELIEIQQILQLFNINSSKHVQFKAQDLFRAMHSDKKACNKQVRVILLQTIGAFQQANNSYTHPIEMQNVQQVLNYMQDSLLEDIC